tara:strand:- start:1180 stop:1563 length:384 start_codon:yes stop_codon:yes gene_type:complete
MATEILLNDGGAPARILPFLAGSAIAAGDPVTMANGDNEVDTVSAADVKVLGYSLTAATSGTMANIITGHGVMLNASVSGALVSGGAMLATDANGYLVDSPTTAGNAVAIALETGSATTGLKKVLTL